MNPARAKEYLLVGQRLRSVPSGGVYFVRDYNRRGSHLASLSAVTSDHLALMSSMTNDPGRWEFA